MELKQSDSRTDVSCAEKLLFEVLPVEILLRLFMEAGRLDCKVVVYLAGMRKGFLGVAVDVMRQLCCEFLGEEEVEVDLLVASWIWHHPEGE
jgi:hypothetical protein